MQFSPEHHRSWNLDHKARSQTCCHGQQGGASKQGCPRPTLLLYKRKDFVLCMGLCVGTNLLLCFGSWLTCADHLSCHAIPGQKSSGAVDFITMFMLLVLWFGISVPLVLLGFRVGIRKEAMHQEQDCISTPPESSQTTSHGNSLF